MATADEYADWIVKNSTKRGTPEFDTVAAAYQEAKAAESGGGKAEGLAMGLADPIHGGAQLLTRALPAGVVDAGNRLNNWIAKNTGLVAELPAGGVDEAVRKREAGYQSARAASGREGMDWMRLLGNVASPVNIGLGAAAPAVNTMRGASAVGAGIGAVSGAMTPATGEDFAAEKMRQVGAGLVVGGAASPLVARLMSRFISPKASTNPELALLKSEGVRPTVGQSLGGWASSVEEKAMSLPVVGDAIRAARQRANEQFNTAAINRALAPIGGKTSGAGHDAVAGAHVDLSRAFEAGKQALGNFQLDRQASAELMNLHQLTRALPTKERRAFDAVWGYLDNEVTPNGSLLADSFRRFDSKAGKDAAQFKGSMDAYQRQAGDAIEELQRIVLESAQRANPQASDALNAAKQGWANLVRVEGAATRAQNQGGVFTPAQLNMAIRSADKSVRKNAVAQGSALMQDLGSAGQSVLGARVPDSGTAGRLVMGGTLLGGAHMIDPLMAAGVIGSAGMYSPPAQALLRGLVSSRPAIAKPVANLLERSSPMFAPGLGLLGVEMVE